MFPYPSGVGLHAGHPEGYTATDIVSRMKRMQGYNVLHPMGYDSFGLPAEQYAVKTGNNPNGFTEIGKLNLRNIGFRGYRKFGANSRLTFEYHSLYEYRRGGNKLDQVPHETDITEQTEHDVNAGGIKYEIFSDGFVRHFNLYEAK